MLQFESINSLSLLCDPILTSIHDYWKNHSFDYSDLYEQSDVSAFKYVSDVYVCYSFSPDEEVSFNFMAAVMKGFWMPKKISWERETKI